VDHPNLEVILMPTMACNMRCDYCYIQEKEPERMTPQLAKKVIEQVVIHNDSSLPTKVYWHGAEPLLMGFDFFQDMLKWSRERYGLDSIQHHIQTNGTLLNDEWFDLFIQEHVTVGVSLDGPPQLHDAHRKMRSGRGSFDLVFGNIMAARKKKLFFDVLCVVTRKNLGLEDELFDFFYEHKIDFGFDPVFPENDWIAQQLALTPQEYAQVAIKLFDRWFFQTERRLNMVVPPYHFLMAILKGGNTYCAFSRCCSQHYVAVSPNGSVHSCVLFAQHPQMSFGNIIEDNLKDILSSEARKPFLESRTTQIAKCLSCEWSAICQSGCPYHAFHQKGTLKSEDTFCESYRLIFQHVHNRVTEALPYHDLANVPQATTS